MGVTAVRMAQQIVEHVETIVALEPLCAAQGIDLRRRETPSMRLGRGTRAANAAIRECVPCIAIDEVLYLHIGRATALVRDGLIARVARQATVEQS